jgi:peptidoglycan/LPS O-acetylase OafA/YrhL
MMTPKEEVAPPLGYIPALDGLRTIAVLTVVVAHSGIGFVNTAVGVDIFFVLSGFLISYLLVEEWGITGHINIGGFYIRRLLRLWPALWFMVMTTGPAMYFSGIHGKLEHAVCLGAISSLSYVSNWLRAFGDNLDIYGHTWSLSVEEQFYILWAALLPLGLRRAGFVRTRRLTLSAIAAIIGWRMFLFSSGAGFDRIYNGFDTHSDGCLAGCALAMFVIDRKHRPSIQNYLARYHFLGVASFVALIVLSFSSTLTDGNLYAVCILPVVSILTTIVIADLVISRDGSISKLLGLRLFVHLGVISYGIYLWHYPLIIASGYAPNYIPDSNFVKLLIGILGGIGMAEISYRLIETPFLRLKRSLGHGTKIPVGSYLNLARPATARDVPPA